MLLTVYTRRTMTTEVARDLIRQHGTAANAARAILSKCRDLNNEPATYNAVRLWIQNGSRGEITTASKQIYDPARDELVNQVANVLEESNIPIEAIRRFKNVKLKSGFHEVVTKDLNGEPVVTKSRSKGVTVLLDPEFKGPEWPVVQPAPPAIVKFNAPTIIKPKGLRTIIVYPDTQFGYLRVMETQTFDGLTETIEHETIHSEEAVNVALQITAALQPDELIHDGDLLDNTELSKYRQTAEFYGTTQKGLDRAKRFLDEAKSAAGPSNRRRGQAKVTPKRYRLVDGNHDHRRLACYVQDNAKAAFGLRQVGAPPESWSVVSTPFLLRLEEIGWEFCGLWPHSEAWIVTEGPHPLVVLHDPRNRGDMDASIIACHTHHHKVEAFASRRPGPFNGFREFTHYQIGCLCHRGPVKSPQAINRSRTPSPRGFSRDWVHGIAVVEVIESTGQHRVEWVQIQDGTALFRGQTFTAETSTRASRSGVKSA